MSIQVLGVSGLEESFCSSRVKRFEGFPRRYSELQFRVENHKILPLPWVDVSQEIPSLFLGSEKSTETDPAWFQTVSRSSPMLWYSALSWKCDLYCRKRGYYKLGPLSITSGDIFGFFPRTKIETEEDYLIVYPRIFDIDHLSLAASYPLGEVTTEKRWFEDPSQAEGVRDYNPGDSLRRIHWKASARRQRLQVKVFESTTTLKIAIFLSVDSFQIQGINTEDELETGISVAASLANYCIESRCQIGLWTNSKLADTNLPARISTGSGIDCLVRVLEALAKVTPVCYQRFPDFFQIERSGLASGATLVFIVSQPSPDIITTILEARSSGYKVVVIQTGTAEIPERGQDISWYRINSDFKIVKAFSGEHNAIY